MKRSDWTGAQVREALRARGMTLTQVARSARKSLSTVSRVVHGRARSAKVERLVAQKLGLPLAAIYPSRVRADAFSVGGRGDLGYEGAAAGRRFGSWGAQNLGPNASVFYSLRTLRSRARELLRNNPWARRGVESIVANLVGTGIVPRWHLPDRPDLKTEIQDLWRRWVDEADADSRLDFYGLEALVTRSIVESGEVLVRLRPRRLSDGLSVPLQLQVLEPEFLDDLNDRPLPNGNVVRMGVEFDTLGRRAAYHLLRAHPGDVIAMSGNPLGGGVAPAVPVPADQVQHLYRMERPGQIRGVPWLTPAILRIHELDQYDDAQLVRQKIAAMLTGFMYQNAEEDLFGTDEGKDDFGQQILGLEPGTMQVVPPGVQKIEWSSPPDAGNTYPEFMKNQLRAVAVALGVTYEQLTTDLSLVNYSSIRAGLVEFRRWAETAQWHVLVFQFCRWVANAWLDAAVLSGALDLPGYAENPAPWRAIAWRPPKWDWVDPEKEANALLKLTRGGFQPRQDGIAALGDDAEEVDRKYAEDNARADALGLVFDSDPRRTKPQGEQQQAVEEKPVGPSRGAAAPR